MITFLRDSQGAHGRLWYALATAHLAAGDDERARSYLQSFVDSPWERLGEPILFVRSLDLLGEIHQRRGEEERAREYYGRFLNHWQDGDIDRERVERARRFLAGQGER